MFKFAKLYGGWWLRIDSTDIDAPADYWAKIWKEVGNRFVTFDEWLNRIKFNIKSGGVFNINSHGGYNNTNESELPLVVKETLEFPQIET